MQRQIEKRSGGQEGEAVRPKGVAALLDSWEPLIEEFPQVADPPTAPEDFF
jgi:hypothetical protein